ncbi:hypothetical protein Phpb_01511 [Photorhabdus namnaonensis]|uniref:Uncharacterized protein n=1 Tax=Photorhabdus namnaonensis TaxID=1851568 RepID=A0A1B8YJW4_9GAMM|nr:hypothetical protein Phpb_01511 [Photorhabdus namnaonensis]
MKMGKFKLQALKKIVFNSYLKPAHHKTISEK